MDWFWFWFWFWFYYALWLASVFTLVLVLRQSSENRSIRKGLYLTVRQPFSKTTESNVYLKTIMEWKSFQLSYAANVRRITSRGPFTLYYLRVPTTLIVSAYIAWPWPPMKSAGNNINRFCLHRVITCYFNMAAAILNLTRYTFCETAMN